MNFQLYAACFLIALLGQLLANLLKANSLKQKAKSGNVQFSVGQYISDDWIAIAASMVFIVICLFLIDTVFKVRPAVVDYIKPIFLFVGYAGGELAGRIFSIANKRLNAAIEEKVPGQKGDESALTQAPTIKEIRAAEKKEV